MRSSCVLINFLKKCFKEIDKGQERSLVYFSCTKVGGAFQWIMEKEFSVGRGVERKGRAEGRRGII